MRNTVLSIFGGLAALLVASASIRAGKPATQDFSVTVSPSTQMATAGGPAVDYTSYLISDGYAGPVTLSCQATAPGVSCSVSPNTVEIDPTLSAAATVTARAAAGVKPGNYTLVIRAEAVGSDPIEQSAVATLEIMPVP